MHYGPRVRYLSVCVSVSVMMYPSVRRPSSVYERKSKSPWCPPYEDERPNDSLIISLLGEGQPLADELRNGGAVDRDIVRLEALRVRNGRYVWPREVPKEDESTVR